MPLTEIEKKERKSIRDKKYREKNPDYVKNYQDENPWVVIIAGWRFRGIIDPDLKSVYDYFITQTNCWICDKEYNKDIQMDRRCLDHDHDLTDEPNIRYICCGYCNFNIIIK